MHVGFLLAWPSYAAVKRIELSHSRGSGSVITTRGRIADDAETKLCRQCNLVVPRQLDECDNCGYDFEAARAASIARWHQAQQRASAKDAACDQSAGDW